MEIVRDNLWLCPDCMIAAVNDDYTGLDYSYSEPEATQRMEKIKAGLAELGLGLVPDFDTESGEGFEEFTRPARGCDCCGSGLAGSFYRFAVLGESEHEKATVRP